MLKERLFKEYDLGENLGYEELMLDEILSYTGRIEDAVVELASEHVYIYENELWETAPKIRSYIEKSIVEYGPPVGINLFEIFRGGQDYYNRYIFDLNLNKIIWNIAVLRLDEIVKECTIELPAYDVLIEEMEDYLEIYLNNIDNNDYIEDIEDIVEDMFNDYLIDNNLEEECKMFKCGLCGKEMEITEIDKAENIAWVCCPEYMEGNDEHDSYAIELTEEIEGGF